jgi:hypothetical protein
MLALVFGYERSLLVFRLFSFQGTNQMFFRSLLRGDLYRISVFSEGQPIHRTVYFSSPCLEFNLVLESIVRGKRRWFGIPRSEGEIIISQNSEFASGFSVKFYGFSLQPAVMQVSGSILPGGDDPFRIVMRLSASVTQPQRLTVTITTEGSGKRFQDIKNIYYIWVHPGSCRIESIPTWRMGQGPDSGAGVFNSFGFENDARPDSLFRKRSKSSNVLCLP